MKENTNEIEAAMELVKLIAQEERSMFADTPANKYYLELYARCFKTVVTAKLHPAGI